MAKTPVITAFPAATIPEPPGTLGESGRELWRTMQARYVLEYGHAEALLMACMARDEIAACTAAIERDGLMLTGSQNQPIANPLISKRAAAEKRVVQCLNAMGVLDEEKRKPGRPPRLFGGS
jgi:P27 family predicted phage terminase small subunit